MMHIPFPPISTKFLNFSLFPQNFNISPHSCEIDVLHFFAPPILTIMHLFIMLYTYWTPLLAWNNECSCRMRQSVCQFHFIYLQSPSIESDQNCLVVSIVFLVRVLTFYCLAGFGARVYSVRLPVENCWHVTLSCFIFILVTICFLEVVIATLCVR